MSLITKIIQNPTIEFGSKRTESTLQNIIGVPQGLSLSNILANLYMYDLDMKMKALSKVEANGILGYYRYVDDILII